MKVVDSYAIKGRGTVLTIDALPEELDAGSVVTDGVSRWKVVGLETHARPRRSTNGLPAGLLLRPNVPLPAMGSELRLVTESA